jgi:acyl transferase domain-containing protein
VIRGSAVNNDGATDGLTVPNQLAQQEVIQLACERSNIRPANVQYVELHGSGTKLGDPIEAEALGAALGTARTTESPLLVGSAKTNIGHLEGAAGIVGLLKVVLSIKHREVPPSLNFETPNPQIAWEELKLRVQCALGSWPRQDRQLVAGVSSFGMGGTNCHVVLSDWSEPCDGLISVDGGAPTANAVVPVEKGLAPFLPWVLSGKSGIALRAQAQRLQEYVEAHPELSMADIGYSLATTRSSFGHRAVLVACDRDDFLAGLGRLREGGTVPGLAQGVADLNGKVVFVFPGQGQQWLGMALELLDSSPVFAERMRECGEELSAFIEWSLLDVLRGVPSAPPLDRTDVVQPVLFAVMVSLAALWQASGIKPDAVVGHSQGEIAAAYVAGALSLHDAAWVVALRSKATETLVECGGMMSVRLPLQQVELRLQQWKSRLSVAVVNGPDSVVVAGDVDAIDGLLIEYEAEGVRARKVAVDYAAHSEHVEEISKQLQGMLSGLTPRSADIPFYSTVTGQQMDTTGLDAEYWGHNLRQTVQFELAY